MKNKLGKPVQIISAKGWYARHLNEGHHIDIPLVCWGLTNMGEVHGMLNDGKKIDFVPNFRTTFVEYVSHPTE